MQHVGWKRRGIRILPLLLIAASCGSPSRGSQPAPPKLIQHEGINAKPGTMAFELQVRTAFGLDTSAAALAAAETHPARNLDPEFAIPLTQAEQDDLEARGRRVPLEQPLQDVVASLSAVTGGSYIDTHARGQYVVVALPALTSAQKASIRAAVPPGGSLRFDRGLLSAARMTQITNELGATFDSSPSHGGIPGLADDLRKAGVTRDSIGGFGPDPPSDTVNISVGHMTLALATRLQAALVARIRGLPPGSFSFSSGGPAIADGERISA